MKQLTERKYLTLLLSLLFLVVVFPILRGTTETRLLLDIVISVVFLASLRVIIVGGRLQVVAFLLGIPTLVGIWTGHLLPGVPKVPASVAFHLLGASFFVFMIVIILRDIHQTKGVSADSVYGAFCGYLFAGLVFGHFYAVVEMLSPGSFRGDLFAESMSEDRRHFLLMYFSFVTLTTVGYGDIVPGTDAVRGMAAAEAITGQFYLAVLIGELIGKRVSQPPADVVERRT